MDLPNDVQADANEEGLSRRDFAILSMAAAGVMANAGPAQAAAVTERALEISTKDGTCDAVLVHAKGGGRKPGVLLYPDAFGLRPAMIDIGKRLAENGYTTLIINQFYRVGKAPIFPADFSFANEADRNRLMQMIADLDHDKVMRDAAAFVAFLDGQPEVDGKAKIGTVGFCMGGSMTIRAAAAAPERVGAVASFHGGRLVTADPTSPHKLIAGSKAAYHIGIAVDDDEKEPQAKTALREALDAAKRPYTLEVYPGALHGWMVPDHPPMYNATQAERGWVAMLALYKEALI
jgi:carboxymethylenebutenolidase